MVTISAVVSASIGLGGVLRSNTAPLLMLRNVSRVPVAKSAALMAFTSDIERLTMMVTASMLVTDPLVKV